MKDWIVISAKSYVTGTLNEDVIYSSLEKCSQKILIYKTEIQTPDSHIPILK